MGINTHIEVQKIMIAEFPINNPPKTNTFAK